MSGPASLSKEAALVQRELLLARLYDAVDARVGRAVAVAAGAAAALGAHTAGAAAARAAAWTPLAAGAAALALALVLALALALAACALLEELRRWRGRVHARSAARATAAAELAAITRARVEPVGGADGRADGRLICDVLPGSPAAPTLLRFIGTRNVGALMAASRGTARDVAAFAAGTPWREGAADDDWRDFFVAPSRVAAWARRFPRARKITIAMVRSKRILTRSTFAAACESASHAIAVQLPQLEEVHIASREAGIGFMESLMAALPGLSRLRVLRVTDRAVPSLGGVDDGHDNATAALSAALPMLPQLEELDLWGNDDFDDEMGGPEPDLGRIPLLLAALPALPRLRTLILGGCSLPTAAMAPLAAALQRLPLLRVLDVRQCCGVSEQGAADLAVAFPMLPHLEELNIGGLFGEPDCFCSLNMDDGHG